MKGCETSLSRSSSASLLGIGPPKMHAAGRTARRPSASGCRALVGRPRRLQAAKMDDEIELVDLDPLGPGRRENVFPMPAVDPAAAKTRIDLRQRPAQDARRFDAPAKDFN